MTFSPTQKTVIRGGMGIFVGPGQTEDQIQPVEAERISTTVSSGPLNAYPVDVAAIRANFINNPNNRSYQPRAYANDYTLPERSTSTRRRCSGSSRASMAATVAYVGSPGPKPLPAQHRQPDDWASSRTAPRRRRRFANSTSSRATPTAASRPFSGRSPKSTTRPAAATTATTRCSSR